MPLRHRKDLARLVARTRIQGRRSPRHYLLAYLWQDREALCAASIDGERDLATQGMHCGNDIEVSIGKDGSTVYNPPPLLGEVHFVANDWNEEVVAHELAHALLHRLETQGQGDLITIEREEEEAICLEFGQWFDQVWAWLWKVNAYGKHAKGTKP